MITNGDAVQGDVLKNRMDRGNDNISSFTKGMLCNDGQIWAMNTNELVEHLTLSVALVCTA